MSGWVWVQRELAKGLRLRVLAWDVTNILPGPGCHCKIVTGSGSFFVRGIELYDTREKPSKTIIKGEPVPSSYGVLVNDPFRGYPSAHHMDVAAGCGTTFGPEVTDSVIVDMLYEGQAARYGAAVYGAIIFSDRINRGSPSSPAPLGTFGTARMSTAGFAKYLASHPEHGTVFSSPIFHNPNHVRKADWSLCQIWTFLPKVRNGRFYVDEAESIGIGPDCAKYKKEEVLEKYKNDCVTYGGGTSDVTIDNLKITYDDVPKAG